jgi:hypothetical protein
LHGKTAHDIKVNLLAGLMDVAEQRQHQHQH